MRYSKEESTYILAVFGSGDAVTIDVYRLSDNTKVVDGDACSEVVGTGVFKYSFTQAASQKEEYLWIMDNGSCKKYGKIVLGGYMDAIKDTVNEHRDTVEPNIDVSISSRALETTVQAIKSQTDRLAFDTSNNVQARVNDKGVLNDPSASDIADAVWGEPAAEHTSVGTFGEKNQRAVPSEDIQDYRADVSALALESTVQAIKAAVDFIKGIEGGRWKIENNQMIFYDEDNSTELARFDLFNAQGQPAEQNVYERRRV